MKIKKKSFEKYRGKVYDLCVENSHTYNVERVCVHNSSASSLVSYVLEITQLDPIKWNLQFERFLGKDNTGMPDIDFDCAAPTELKELLKKEWGEYSVVAISNFNRLKLRSLVKDVSKYYGVPFQEVNFVTSKMMEEATKKAKEVHEILAGVYDPTYEELRDYSPTFQKYIKTYPEIEKHLSVLNGQIKCTGRHAGGVVVSQNLNEHMPLIRSGGNTQTPWTEGITARHLESMGFIKYDILGLSTLELIQTCIEHILIRKNKDVPTFEEIKQFYNDNLHPDKIDFEDQNVWKNVFQDGKFLDIIFQFTGESARKFCKQVKPNNIQQLSDVTSIVRPGPLASSVDKKYLAVKNGEEVICYDHPIIEEVLGKTYGNCIYQEQISELVHKLGKNISLDEGNKLRKLLVKKGIGEHNEEKQKIYDKLFLGCEEKSIPRKRVEEIIEMMELFSGYGFCNCLSWDTTINTFNGEKKIKDVKIGDFVESKYGFVKVKDVFKQGKKRIYEITTNKGKKIKCTLEHKLETPYGMKPLKEILEKKYSIITKLGK